MLLSKKIQAVNHFVLSKGKPPKVNPIAYTKPMIKMMVITPNELLTHGLKVTLVESDVVQIIRDNLSAINALEYWSQQEKETYPDIVVLDTQQRKITCKEAIMRFKHLNDKMKVLVMGDHFRNEHISEYFDAGADGYIDQAASSACVAHAAYLLVHEGKQFLFTPSLPMHGYIVLEPYER